MFLKIIIAIVMLVSTSCAHRSSVVSKETATPQTNLNAASKEVLLRHVDQKVTIRGQFSLRGKIGPYILAQSGPIYLVPQGNFTWGDAHARMEGRDVSVTGILRFRHYPDDGISSEARPHDHFYFEAEKATIELSGN